MTERVIYTADELAALPFGSVVVASGGTARTKVRGNSVYTGSGWASGDTGPITNEMLADGRALWVAYKKGEDLPESLLVSQRHFEERSKARLQTEAHYPAGYMPACPIWGIWMDDPTGVFGSHRPFFEEGQTATEAIEHALSRYGVEGARPMRGVEAFLANDTVKPTPVESERVAS